LTRGASDLLVANGNSFYVVDHNDIDRHFLRFQLQAELLLNLKTAVRQ